MILTIQLAAPIVEPKPDGSGYEILTAYDGHNIQLQIGNVSIAFDGRNEFKAIGDEAYCDPIMEFSGYHDCPVRLDGDDCPKCDDVAETILFALAADLGYTVSK